MSVTEDEVSRIGETESTYIVKATDLKSYVPKL